MAAAPTGGDRRGPHTKVRLRLPPLGMPVFNIQMSQCPAQVGNMDYPTVSVLTKRIPW